MRSLRGNNSATTRSKITVIAPAGRESPGKLSKPLMKSRHGRNIGGILQKRARSRPRLNFNTFIWAGHHEFRRRHSRDNRAIIDSCLLFQHGLEIGRDPEGV